MSFIITIVCCVAFPLLVSYVVGRNRIDPDIKEGKEYYKC